MAAQVEEVVVRPHPLDSQQLRPDPRHQLLDRRPRRHVTGRRDPPFRPRQRLAVDLAVGRPRQRAEHHEARRHHGLGQPPTQEAAQLPRLRTRLLARRQVGHQGTPLRQVAARHDHRLAHRGMGRERRLDLSQLDAEAADLDLMIEPAEVVEAAVRQPADEVSRAVEPLAWPTGGIGHEAFRGQLRPSQVATGEAGPAQAQLPGHPHRHRPEPPVQQMRPRVVERPADQHPLGAALHLGPGRIGGVLRRSVEVEQAPHLGVAMDARGEPRQQRLAGQAHRAEPRRQLCSFCTLFACSNCSGVMIFSLTRRSPSR